MSDDANPERAQTPLQLVESLTGRAREAANYPYALCDRIRAITFTENDREVVETLALLASYATSEETVRRYRGGLATRIDVAFVAALARAYPVDAGWLLTGRCDGGEGQRAAAFGAKVAVLAREYLDEDSTP